MTMSIRFVLSSDISARTVSRTVPRQWFTGF